jgi:predicted nucleic acid-binding protein
MRRIDRIVGEHTSAGYHGWSFTDCLSIHLIRKPRLRQALTKDAHFTEAGLTVLLPNP